MKVKKKDLLGLHNSIMAMEGNAYSVKFSYFIAKNKVALRDEITALEDVRRVSDEFKAFETVRVKLAQENADKNEDGSAKISGNSFVITSNAEKFQKELEAVKLQYSKIIKKREKQLKEFEELLESEAEFEGAKIDFKDIPQNVEPKVLEVLILCDLIIEDEN